MSDHETDEDQTCKLQEDPKEIVTAKQMSGLGTESWTCQWEVDRHPEQP